jgi:transposase InsO family protein
MGRRGNPYDNAKAESFMKTLKVEAVYLMDYETFEDVGFLKNNPMQSSRAYPILSDASVFPGSKIGTPSTVATSLTGGTEALRIERGAPSALDQGVGGADKLV